MESLRNVGTVAQHLASMSVALNRCSPDWESKHRANIDQIVLDFFPSGSGWDNGTTFDADGRADRLVFTGAFHHMNDAGMYDGWTEHKIVARPEFIGVSVSVSGRNRNGVKDYLGDMFHQCLTTRIGFDEASGRYIRVK